MHEPDAAVHHHAAADEADVGADRAELETEVLGDPLLSITSAATFASRGGRGGVGEVATPSVNVWPSGVP